MGKVSSFRALIQIVVLWFTFAQGKTQGFEEVDAYAIATPVSKTKEVAALAAHLTRPWTSDILKVRAIYRWITENVAYNYSALYFKATEVLNTRIAVCAGYADLFEELCVAAGIEAKTVTGFAKTKLSDIGSDLGKTDHAWNIVTIDGTPYLIDPTWASGCYGKGFIKRLDDAWFFADPSFAIYSHLPLEEADQLLTIPVKEKEFVNAPLVYSNAGMNQMNQFRPEKGIISVKDSIRLTFESPMNLKIYVGIDENNHSVEKYYHEGVTRQGMLYTVTLPKPKAGKYVLQLGAKDLEDITGSYDICAEWILEVK